MKVHLLKAHRHAHHDYCKGESIAVTSAEAEWLAAQGVIATPKEPVADAATHSRGKPRAPKD